MAGWLKAAIEQAGITKFQLARDSGVPRSHIYNLLNGDVNPRWDIVQKLARALRASMPELGKTPHVDREIATHQALLKQGIADLDHVTRVLGGLREALVEGLIFKDRRQGRKPKGLGRSSKPRRRRG